MNSRLEHLLDETLIENPDRTIGTRDRLAEPKGDLFRGFMALGPSANVEGTSGPRAGERTPQGRSRRLPCQTRTSMISTLDCGCGTSWPSALRPSTWNSIAS